MNARLQAAFAPQTLARRGLAIYSVRRELEHGLEPVLARAATLGFQDLEMRAVVPEEARQHRALLDRHGLACPSVVAGPDLPPAQQVEAARILGARWLSVPALPVYFTQQGGRFQWKPRISAAEFAPMVALLTGLARACQAASIRLAYHMHDNDFVPLEDGFSPFERLMARIDPALMDFELDLGHAAAARPDWTVLLQRLRGRVPLLHLKDYDPTRVNEPKGAAMTDVGDGVISFDALLPALRELGAQHLFIELEASQNQWQGVERSAAWLASHGYF